MPARITVNNNGSYRVEGDFELYDSAGDKCDLAGGRGSLNQRTKDKIMKKILTVFFLLTLPVVAHAQVSLLWESQSTYGSKNVVYSFVDNSHPHNTYLYYFVNDTSTHQLKFYDSDSFTLVYTLSAAGSQDYVFYSLPDMNGNSFPEVVVMSYSYPNYRVLIRDLSTGATLYSWGEAAYAYTLGSLFKTPGSNILKLALTKTNIANNSSTLVVYSLGISTNSVNDRTSTPTQVSLDQSFPNPFNSQTRIGYELPASGPMSLEIFDVRGRLIRTFTQVQSTGQHEIIWDGRDGAGMPVASGAYFYRLVFNGSFGTKKAILLR